MKSTISIAAAVASIGLLAGCASVTGADSAPTTHAPAAAAVLSSNVAVAAKDVPVDTVVSANVKGGSITDAVLYSGSNADENHVAGQVSGDSWIAGHLLKPATTYHLKATAKNADGKTAVLTRTFTTQALTLAQQTYPSVSPLSGTTVGVGMPIIVTFDVAVKNKALFQRKMFVKTSKPVTGTWDWVSDHQARFRPSRYWPAHTHVTVDLEVGGLPAGNGIYGQKDQLVKFTIGDKVVSTVNIATHQLKYTVNGKTIKTIPVTTGDSGHKTREGTKVIMEKFSSIDMDAATTGVEVGAPGYYNIKDVRYAMRLTNSGEFLHAAPWSVAYQGNSNVSHGCTGMSTANAKWLFEHSRIGDVVTYVDGSRPLEAGNGWTDWNQTYAEFSQGSALPSVNG